MRQERRPIDAPMRQGGFDADYLVGESQFSADQAGERVTMHPRHTGGPPSDEQFTSTSGNDLARRCLEEATQSPAHEHFEPGADFETEPEAESSWGEDDEDQDLELQQSLDAEFAEDEDDDDRYR